MPYICNISYNIPYYFYRYLFKRTKDIGKWSSMLYTYLFIILWHGVLPGYWMAFLFEIPVISAEKQLGRVLNHYFGESSSWDPAILTICKSKKIRLLW